MSKRVAINGFGRTGRQALKAIWQGHRADLQLAAIGLQSPDDAPAAAHLLRHDSNYGRFGEDVEVEGDRLRIGELTVPLVAAPSLSQLPWRDLGIDIVIEASGAYTRASDARGHIAAGARKVVITAGSDDADCTVIYGVNHLAYDGRRHHVVATDTETTNAAAVVLSVVAEAFPVERVMVTAVHAYTNAQKLIDATDTDLRRARSAPLSIVPTTTRAASAVGLHVRRLTGLVDGYAVRVPVAVVSVVEMIARLSETADPARINGVLREAAAGALAGVLAVTDEPLVSTDYRGDRHSAVVDAPLTMAIGPLAKISAWYDNEWGYSNRVADVAALVASGLDSE